MRDLRPLVPVSEEGLDEIARSLLEEIPPDDSGQLLNVRANINRADYIKIPNTNVLIAKQEIHKGLKWGETIYALQENGLYMPPPGLFIPYFLNVKKAKEGKITLYDGNNAPISQSEAEDLYKYLTSSHRGGCWTWLDAYFSQGTGHLNLNLRTNHRVHINSNGTKQLVYTESPLEQCLNEDCYVALKFNSQGLATEKDKGKQEYKQGDNIKFWYPRENAVARLYANSLRAYLSCLGDPEFSNSSLGVFACAEGTSR